MSRLKKTPFTVNVFDLIHKPGEHKEIALDIKAPEKLGEGLVAVIEGQPIHIDLQLESLHDGILVTAEVETVAKGECGRCLEPMQLDLQVEFQELFAYSLDEAFDYEVQDDHVDLEPLVRDAVVLALPFQPICRPDCAGLNPETGARNAQPVASDAEQNVDPRWAALSEYNAQE